MRQMTHTIIDTLHVVATAVITCLLFAQVISREQPAWAEFILQSLVVLAASMVLVRIVGWSGRRQRNY